MVYEYAIDPKLLAACSDRVHGKLFTKNFGLGTSRIFSVYPKVSKWKKIVYETFSELAEEDLGDEKLQAKRQFEKNQNLTALVQHLVDSSVRRPDLVWNPEETWLNNVLPQHAKDPFKGLLSPEPCNDCSEIINWDNLVTEDHPSWLVDEQIDVPSNPQEMAKTLKPLLRIAKEIIFVDPYFRGDHKKRWAKPFQGFFQAISTSHWKMSEIKLEIHASKSIEKAPSAEYFKEECEKYMPGIIPVGLQVKFIRWSAVSDGEELHNRYVLTNLGGVKVDPGFDERSTKSRGASTEFILLKEEIYKKRWDQYTNGQAFELAEEPFLITGIRS